MNIAMINSVLGKGSTGTITQELFHQAEASGHKALVYYGRGKKNDNNSFVKFSKDNSVYLHVLGTRVTDKHGQCSKRDTRKLINLLEEQSPDLIHLHNIHGYYVNYELLFRELKQMKKPIVWTLHDCWPITGHCAHFDAISCEKWKSGCYDCPQLNEYPKSYVDNSQSNYHKKMSSFTGVSKMTITTPSHWMKNTLESSFLKDYPIKTIYNGIDLGIFKKKSLILEERGLSNNIIVLGVANVWSTNKGLIDFIELAKILPDEYRIVLIGLTKAQIKNLPGNIIGIEKTSSVSKLVEWYSAADVYFNASIEESMGLTTVEAMACGTPVVVYDATAVPEVVDTNSGLIVEKNNIVKAKEAILKVVNKEKYSSENCRQRAEKFEKIKQYNKYIDLYEELWEK